MDSQLRVYVGADTAMFKKLIKSALGTLNHFTKVSVDAGNTIRRAFVNAFAITSAYDFFNNLIKVGSGFEDLMAKVKAVTNATTTQLKMMELEAARLGATTAYTASQAAKALENLTRNGLSARKATKSLSSVLELAGANAIELADAADIVTNTMNMFELQVEDLNEVNDVLSATCANSATNITDLYEAMKYAGSTANLFGISLKETSAALGVLANMGIKGSDAGTALRSMLLRLAAPTTKAADVLREYGLEIDQTTIKMDGLEKTIKKLYDSGIGNDVSALQALFGKLFGGTNAALINSYGSLVNMNQVTAGSEGTAARMFKQGMGEFKAAADSFSSNLESAMIQLFNNIKPIGIWLLNTMNDIVSMAKSTGWWLMNGAIIGLGKATQHTTRMSKEAQLILKFSNEAVEVFRGMVINKEANWGINNDSLSTLKSLKEAYLGISQEALKLGITLTDVNNASIVAGKAVSAIRLKDSTGLMNSLIELLELYNEISEAANRTNAVSNNLWNNIKNGAKSAGKAIVNFFGGWWNIGITGVIVAANSIYNAWLKSTRALKEYKASLKELEINNDRLDTSFKKAALSLEKLTKGSGAWKATVEYLKREYPELIDKIDLEAMHVNASKKAWDGYKVAIDNAIEALKKFNKAEAAQKSIDSLSEDLLNKRFGAIFKKANANASESDKILISQAESEILTLIKTGKATLEDFLSVFSKYNITDNQSIWGYGNVNNVDKQINNLLNSEIYKELKELNKNFLEQDEPVLNQARLNEDLAKYMARFEANKAALEEEGKLAGKDLETINSEIQSLAEKFVNEIINKYKGVQIDGKKATDLLGANVNFQNIRMASVVTDTGGDTGSDTGSEVVDGSIAAIKAEIAALQAQLENWNLAGKIDLLTEIYKQIDKLKKELDKLEKEQRYVQLGIKYSQPLQETKSSTPFMDVAKISDPKQISLKPLAENVESNAEKYVTALNAMADATRAFNSTKFEDDGLGWTQWAANVLASIGATIPAIMALCQAEGVKSAFKLPFPANLAAAATVMAAVVAMFASLPAFANGGIVGGNSTIGDHNLVRVNSGEMILNGRQLKNLFNLLNGGGVNSGSGGQVEFKIRGKELVGVLNNYNNKVSKVL